MADDRYTLLDEIDVGGFGRVTRRFDRTLRRVVAAKQPLAEKAGTQELLLHEARLLAYLDHPGVVPIYDAAEQGYVMKLLAGEPLNQVLARYRKARQRMPVREALRIVRRVSETLANAHDKGVVHLDIKPANLMLDRYQVSIVDWGSAQFYNPEPYEAYLRTGGMEIEIPVPRGRARGTPVYMPHEQLTGLAAALGPAADIFAVGAVLYEMVAGRRPFPRSHSVGEEAMARLSPPAALTTVRARVPPRLDEICRRMLALRADDRPQSFQEVIAELDALASYGESRETRALEPGDVLFSEGDDADVAYQVLSGAVDIHLDTPRGPEIIARRAVGEVIGEMALINGSPRSATVVAAEPTTLEVIRPDRIDQELARTNPLIAQMLRALSTRLREADHRAERRAGESES